MKETEAEFERKYNKTTCNNSFQSPILKKYVSTINDYVYYESDKQVDMISDSNKQVDASIEPNEETHIIDRIRKFSVRQLCEPAVIGVIGQDLVTNFKENFRVELSINSLSPLNTITSKAIVIGATCNSAQVDSNTLKVVPQLIGQFRILVGLVPQEIT